MKGDAASGTAGAETREELEAKLREAQLLLRAILDTLPITVARYDREGVFTFQDGKGLAAVGMKPGQLLGANVIELCGDDPELRESHPAGARGEGLVQPLRGATASDGRHGTSPCATATGEPDGMITISPGRLRGEGQRG